MKKVSFSKNLAVTVSSRGCVIAWVKGTDIMVTKEMDPMLKAKIETMPYKEHFKPWQEAMEKLKKEAENEARIQFKKWKVEK